MRVKTLDIKLKKNFLLSIGCLTQFFISNLAESTPAYRYRLSENLMIQAACRVNNQKEISQIKLVFDNPAAGSSHTNVKFKAQLCTRQYGFREIKIWVNFPREVLYQENLHELLIGQTQHFSAIPSTNIHGRMLKLDISNLGDSQIIVNNQQIALKTYQVSWLASAQAGPEYLPFQFFIADPRDLKEIPGFRGEIHEPWAKINFQFKHKMVSSPFIMTGNLYSVEED